VPAKSASRHHRPGGGQLRQRGTSSKDEASHRSLAAVLPKFARYLGIDCLARWTYLPQERRVPRFGEVITSGSERFGFLIIAGALMLVQNEELPRDDDVQVCPPAPSVIPASRFPSEGQAPPAGGLAAAPHDSRSTSYCPASPCLHGGRLRFVDRSHLRLRGEAAGEADARIRDAAANSRSPKSVRIGTRPLGERA
jgi:hypothetical protein